VTDPPAGIDGVVAMIVPVAPTAGVSHVHPAGVVSDWNVVFAGTASLS